MRLIIQLVLLALAVSASGTQAQTFRSGEFSGFLNLEASYGLRVRMEDYDKDIIGPANIKGGTFHINPDDGNLNYDKGDLVANVFTLKPELAVRWRNFGLYAKGYAFYDFENSDGSRDHAPLSDAAKDDVAHDADFQEAYLSVEFMLGDMPTRFRVGKQVLNWGQANFFQGVNVVNPVHLPQFGMPGATSSDLFQGQDMVWGLIAINPLLSVEAFYQYDWEPSELNSGGTYMSVYDGFEGVETYGGSNSFLLGTSNDTGATETLPVLGLPVPLEACEAMNGGTGPRTFSCLTDAFQAVPSIRPDEPDDKSGDWGISLRTVIPQLNDSELAFHYANYTSHSPRTRIGLGNFTSLAELGFEDPQFDAAMPVPYTPEGVGQITQELIANGLCSPVDCASVADALSLHWPLRTAYTQYYYPEKDIDLYGLSWATSTPITGTAIAAEIVYQQDVAAQIHSADVLWGAANPTVTSPDCNVGPTTQVGPIRLPCAPQELRSGPVDELVIYRDTWQVTLSAVQLFPSGILGSDSWTLGMEASWLHIDDLPDTTSDASFCVTRPDQRASRDDVAFLAVPGTRISQCDDSQYAYVDDNSWGYRAFAAATWNGVFGALSVTPRILFKDDVDGNSTQGMFIEGRQELNVGVRTSLLSSASIDISYRAFWGAGTNNLINDRDYLDVVFKYEF